MCQQIKEEIKPEVEQRSLDSELVSQNREEDLHSTGFDRVLLVGGMTRMPKVYKFLIYFCVCRLFCGDMWTDKSSLPRRYIEKSIRNIVEEVFKKKIFNSRLEEGALATGAVYSGVFLGDINYFDNRRTSKNEIIKMASQKMFIGERNRDEEDAAKLFWEAIAIYVKEYYSSLHIDIRSRNAIKGLGYFALRHTDRGIPHGHSAIYLSDIIPKRGACWVFEGEHERLCKAAFNFFKNFLFINKKKVWSKLKPYVLGKKLVTEEKEDLINKDFQKLKFKRISTRERKGLRKQKLKKYFLFKAY
ncbi:unnamed protein product [Meloidogyne enterolobii]|uniref:Uncharacterized protein n=1 Tax=Meloidogyne enterolobii TaxID=390850 RepID=A0ACB0ZX81_MELEN